MSIEIIAYADGGCSGNPGIGGWGVSLQAFRDGRLLKQRSLSGASPSATNNQMELRAAIEALNALDRPSKLTLVTDSRYLVDGATKWLPGWKARGWKTKNNQDVKNKPLWLELERAASRHEVRWQWTKGHADSDGNNLADSLAQEAIGALKKTMKANGAGPRSGKAPGR